MSHNRCNPNAGDRRVANQNQRHHLHNSSNIHYNNKYRSHPAIQFHSYHLYQSSIVLLHVPTHYMWVFLHKYYIAIDVPLINLFEVVMSLLAITHFRIIYPLFGHFARCFGPTPRFTRLGNTDLVMMAKCLVFDMIHMSLRLRYRAISQMCRRYDECSCIAWYFTSPHESVFILDDFF